MRLGGFLNRSAAATAVAAVALVALTGCSYGPPAPIPSPPPGAVAITAEHTAFVERQLEAPAGAPFTLYLANHDNEAHNVRVLDSSNMSVAATEIFTGPAARTVEVAALAPGTYRLACDIHSEMTAELLVE